jgi:hypothetical protein
MTKILEVWTPHSMSIKLLSETGKGRKYSEQLLCSHKYILISFGTASHIYPFLAPLYILHFGLASQVKKNPNMINF